MSFFVFKGFEQDLTCRDFQFIKEICPNLQQWQIVWILKMLDLIKEDNIMPFNTTTIKGKFVWEEKKPADFYDEVWAFMKETDEMSADEFCECFGCGKEVYDIFSNFEEAKKTLDEYKAKNVIKPGDYVRVKLKDNAYTDYDLLVIDIDKPWCGGDYHYRCIGRKRGSDPALINENSYIFLHLMHSQVEKTGKSCKHFNYAMYTLFEDCWNKEDK